MYQFSGYKPGHEAHGVSPDPTNAFGTELPLEIPPLEEEASSFSPQSFTPVDKPSLTLLVPQQLLAPHYIDFLTSGQATMELANVPPENTQGDNANGDDV